MSATFPQVAIVVPAYNEEARIGRTIECWLAVLHSVGGHLIVVIDGATDSTAGVVESFRHDRRLVVIDKPNGGHSSAIIAGYRAALALGTPFMFQADGDSPVEPKDFFDLWQQRGRFD